MIPGVGLTIQSNLTTIGNEFFFTNHQKWKISLGKTDAGDLEFHLLDCFGVKCTTSDCVFQNIDPEFQKAFLECRSLEGKKELLFQYGSDQLRRSSSYQVHVDKHNGQKIVRFGEYGLKGGGKGEERVLGGVVSILLVLGGVAMITAQTEDGELGWTKTSVGVALISSGFSGATYACNTTTENYDSCDFSKICGYGFLGGAISGFFRWMGTGAKTVDRLFWVTIGGSVSNMATNLFYKAVERGESVPLKRVAQYALSGGTERLIGSLVDDGIYSLFPLHPTRFDLSEGVKLVALDCTKGFSSSFMYQILRNRFMHHILGNRNGEEDWIHRAFQYGMAGAVISGLITGVKHTYCIWNHQVQIEKIKKAREVWIAKQEEIKDEQAWQAWKQALDDFNRSSEKSMQGLKQELDKIHRSVEEKNVALKSLRITNSFD